MTKKPAEAELLEDAHSFLQPVRCRHMALLTEKPMHISELSRAMSEERRLVTYHLIKLEERGFVTSKYEISEQANSKRKAIRICTVTDKATDVKAKLKKRR